MTITNVALEFDAEGFTKKRRKKEEEAYHTQCCIHFQNILRVTTKRPLKDATLGYMANYVFVFIKAKK